MQNTAIGTGKRHYENPKVISAKHLQLETVASRHARQIEFVLAKPFNEEETVRVFLDYFAKDGPVFHEFYAAKKRLYSQDPEVQKRLMAKVAEAGRVAGIGERVEKLMVVFRMLSYQPVTELSNAVLEEMVGVSWKREQDDLHERVCEKALNEEVLGHGTMNRALIGYPLANIMLEGRLHSLNRVVDSGGFLLGNGSVSAEPHGPPYVILEKGTNANAPDGGYQITEDLHIAYLIRDDAQKECIRKAMDCGLGLGLLTPNEHKLVLSKLITYEGFLAAPAGAFESVEAFQRLVVEQRT